MDFWDYWYTEEEVCKIIGISSSTLAGRISSGTEHPPYQELKRGKRIYDKSLFADWAKKRPVIYEVKSAG